MIRPTILDGPLPRLPDGFSRMKDTVLFPRADPRPSTSFAQQTGPLAPELLSQSVRRLRVLALLYAFIFFMAGFFPSLLVAEDRAHMLGEPRPLGAGCRVDCPGAARRRVHAPALGPPVDGVERRSRVRGGELLRDRHCGVHRALPARHERMDRPVVGGGLDVAVRRRHSNPPGQSRPVHAGLGERGPCGRRLHDRDRDGRRSSPIP